MKKYILFLFVLAFVFGLSLFSINAKSVGASTDCTISTTLRVGSRGTDVVCLQTSLGGLVADGNFGQRTRAAVIAFQIKYDLGADGIFGPRSRASWVANGGVSGNFPDGCESASGYSRTTGLPCYVIPSSHSSVVISGVSGPQSLNVNQQGTWVVTASDPSGGNLSYLVNWGDEVNRLLGQSPSSASTNQQSATFSHSYSQAGTYTPTFYVANSNGQRVNTSLSVSVTNTNTSALTISTSSLPNATVGQPYYQSIRTNWDKIVYGYTYLVTAGSLPSGLFTETSCEPYAYVCGGIKGTPTTAGSYIFTIKFTFSDGTTASKQFTLTVDPATSSTFYIATSSLPNATVGNLYSIPIETVGGDNTQAYNWQVNSGSFPTGTSFIQELPWTSSSWYFGSVRGHITGTPTVAGTYTFNIQFVQGSLLATKQLTLTVDPATCSVSDIYAVAVPGFAYSNVYMKVNNLPPSGGQDSQVGYVAIAGADTWNNLIFSLDGGYSVSGQTILKATQTVNSSTGVSYILTRRSSIYPTFNGTTAVECAPIGNVLGAKSFNFTQFLSEGSQGNEVMELQKFLNGAGYDAGTADGKFGLKTRAALIQFQTANNLKSDGIVGPEVRAFLNK